MPPELSVGDFVYQADQELFLVVIGEEEESYRFAVHGWREIGKDRLDEYISHNSGELHSADIIDEMVEDKASNDVTETYEKMKKMFESYEYIELEAEGPHTEFILDDT
jgi:hypothetical protein